MTDLDDTIRKVLSEDAGEPGGDGTPSVPRMILDSFRGQSRSTTFFVWMKMSATLLLCCLAVLGFFLAESTRVQLAWSALFTIGFVGFAMWWIWYWMFLNCNATLREIKRLELEVAQMRDQIGG